MVEVKLTNVVVDVPVYNTKSRFLTASLIDVATGGRLNAAKDGHVQVRALDDINLDVKDGERVGLLGHNGAGKSTLLRVLSKVYAPSSGSAVIKGNVGSLIDISLGINPEASGLENIFIRGQLLGLSKGTIKKKLADIIAFSELGNFINLPVRTYSTGMHMRLAFAVATEIRPEILLMDEWLSVGDEDFKHKAEARLAGLVDGANILFLASHSREMIEKTCTRVLVLEHGRIVHAGTPAEILPIYFGS